MQEEKYLVSSPSIQISFPDGSEESLDGYAELEYVDQGIIRISGKDQVYQMLANGSSIRLADNTVLDLQERSIRQNEEVSLYFSEILPDELSGANIPVTPAAERELKVPVLTSPPSTARMDSREKMEAKALKVRLEKPEEPVRKEKRAKKATWEKKAKKETRERKETREIPAAKETTEAPETTAPPAVMERTERRERPALPVRPGAAEAEARPRKWLCRSIC